PSRHCVAHAPTVESLCRQVFSASRIESPVLPTPVSPTSRTFALVYCSCAGASAMSSRRVRAVTGPRSFHIRSTPLTAVEIPKRLSALNDTLRTESKCPLNTPSARPDSTSQYLTVVSSEPDSAWRPSALNATLRTAPVWPSYTPSVRPDATSHSRIVLSLE